MVLTSYPLGFDGLADTTAATFGDPEAVGPAARSAFADAAARLVDGSGSASPPLLAASGASVLAHLVGQTIFVVEAIRTPQSAMQEALSQLKSVRNVGLVLNKSRSKEGLAYQYGSYYAHSSDPR